MKKITKLFFIAVMSFIATTVSAQSFEFQWAKLISGPGTDQGFGITTDATGNVYHCGFFTGTTDFDPGSGTFSLTSIAAGGGYVSKLDASGNFVWAAAMPGIAYKVAVDATGNVFVTGTFNGTEDFDPGSGTMNMTATSTNNTDQYICKFDNAGNFVWAGQLGGIDSEAPASISTDASGNVIIAGSFRNTVDFDPGAGTYTISSSGNVDGYVLKLTNSGGFLWAAKFGSSASYEGTCGAVADAAGNIYVTGTAVGTTDFDPSPTSVVTVTASTSSSDIYLLKLDASGNFGWVKLFGSTFANDESRAIALDATGNIYIAGNFADGADFDPSPTSTTTLTVVGGLDCFVAKYDNTGNLIFAKGFGSAAYDCCKDIKVSASGNICYTGVFFQNADFDPSAAGTYTVACAGPNDAFIGAMDNGGNFLWAGALAPWSYDNIDQVALNATGDIYVNGSFMFNTDFDPGAGVFNLSSTATDAFILKLSNGAVGVKETTLTKSDISVYPNPFTNFITIKTENTGSLKNLRLSIFDITGRELKNQEVTGSAMIDMSNFKTGLYFYKITQDSKTVTSGKLIAE